MGPLGHTAFALPFFIDSLPIDALPFCLANTVLTFHQTGQNLWQTQQNYKIRPRITKRKLKLQNASQNYKTQAEITKGELKLQNAS